MKTNRNMSGLRVAMTARYRSNTLTMDSQPRDNSTLSDVIAEWDGVSSDDDCGCICTHTEITRGGLYNCPKGH